MARVYYAAARDGVSQDTRGGSIAGRAFPIMLSFPDCLGASQPLRFYVLDVDFVSAFLNGERSSRPHLRHWLRRGIGSSRNEGGGGPFPGSPSLPWPSCLHRTASLASVAIAGADSSPAGRSRGHGETLRRNLKPFRRAAGRSCLRSPLRIVRAHFAKSSAPVHERHSRRVDSRGGRGNHACRRKTVAVCL